MNSLELKNLFRAEVRDEDEPYLWSDVEVYSYMDDAQKMFCRLAGGIPDAASALCSISVAIGDEFVKYDPRILKLRKVQRLSDYHEVDILNFENLEDTRFDLSDYGRAGTVDLDDTTGEIRAVITNMEKNKLRLVYIPTATETLKLIVYRLPMRPITGEGQDLEIDELHHRHILYWMKHLAHQKQDADTFDRGRSAECAIQFRDYCDQAKADRERREYKPRAIIYGGY